MLRIMSRGGRRRSPALTQAALPTLLFLVCVEIALVLMHLFAHSAPPPLHHLQLWFDLHSERTIASWFSSSQLLVAGLMLCFAAWREWGRGPEAALFATAGLGFAFLSADEAASIHEEITRFTVKYSFVPRFEGDHGVWIFVYALLGLTLCVLFHRGLFAVWRGRRQAALLFGVGFLTIVAGGVLVEILWYYGLASGHLQAVTEEFLEMFGASLVVCGALVLISPMIRLTSLD